MILRLYDAGKESGGGPGLAAALQSAGGVPDSLVSAFRSVLKDARIDAQCAALATTLPTESELVEDIPETDPILLHKVCAYLKTELARQLRGDLEEVVAANDAQPGGWVPDASVKRPERMCKEYAANVERRIVGTRCLEGMVLVS